MKKHFPAIAGVVLASWLGGPVLSAAARAAEPVYPLKVGENRRYFIGQKGEPVFWLGTTQWQLFRQLNLAARHKDGTWLMAYLADRASFSIDLRKLTDAKRTAAFWVDPRTGQPTPASDFPVDRRQSFTTPDGWEDALLIVEPAPE